MIEVNQGNASNEQAHLKCLIVSETYLPLFGGAEMYTYNFAKQLVLRGYDVTILTHTEGAIPEGYQIDGITVQVVKPVSKRRFWELPRLLNQLHYTAKTHDFLFANYTYTLSSLLAIIATLQWKRITVFAHGLGTIIDSTHPRIYHLYRYISLRLARSVITTSEEIAEIVRPFNQRVLVATAVDFASVNAASAIEYIPIKRNVQGKTILTVRRLVEKNGIQFLIEAMPYLLKLRKDVTYLVIGDGRLRDKLQLRVQELKLEKNILFLGEIRNEDVFPYIAHADTVIFPSSAEALSLAAIECMYLGVPIVASAIGGLLELVGNNERGILIDLFGRTSSVYDAPEPISLSEETYLIFAQAIDRALSHDEEVTAKAHAARTYVESRYNWPKVAGEILTFVKADPSAL